MLHSGQCIGSAESHEDVVSQDAIEQKQVERKEMGMVSPNSPVIQHLSAVAC